jgi:hypothetical protein
MQVTFLASAQGTPATKIFSRNEQGEIKTTGYPSIYEFNSFTEEFSTIEELYNLVISHASKHHCMLKGKLSRPLVAESRRGSTNADDMTTFEVFDIDGLKGATDVQDFITKCLPSEYHDVDHIVQYSSSYGVLPAKGLSAHIFILHARPVMPVILKQHITNLNLTNATLKAELSLNKVGTGLKFPLDRTVAQNDKLIYIAPPICQQGVTESLGASRISLVKKRNRHVDIRFASFNEALNRKLEDEIVAELREKIGLEKKKVKYKFVNDVQVCANPDPSEITAPPKHERGFVYLSLNGGDSYPFWYPEENPNILYNWHGEPPVLLKDFLPSYWEKIAKKRIARAHDRKYLVFRDFASDTYWNGYYDATNADLMIARTGSKDKLNDFLRQHDQPVPDCIQDWNYKFDPSNPTIIDYDKRFINKFKLSEYMRNPTRGIKEVPPLINRILWSLVGDDKQAYNHLVNWLANIIQFREKIGTAWVVHGVEGTGKGLLYHRIIGPILGPEYCAIKQLADFDDQFNDWQETCLFLFVDEPRISDAGNASKTISQLKNMITEPKGRIRRMHAGQQEIRLYANIMFASNNYDAMHVSSTDRRLNIAPRQEKKLQITQAEVDSIIHELPAFAGYLMEYKADRELARQVISNQAKLDMQAASQNSVEQFCEAVRNGNLEYFAQFLDEATSTSMLHIQAEFERVVRKWVAESVDMDTFVSRNDLSIAYSYMQAEKELSANKFNRLLGHHNLIIKAIKTGGHQAYGLRTTWKATDEQRIIWAKSNVVQLKAASK